MEQHTYLVIDLKSFYASVECAERGLDPMTARLVVADPERTEKTICLAISPAMKALGIHNPVSYTHLIYSSFAKPAALSNTYWFRLRTTKRIIPTASASSACARYACSSWSKDANPWEGRSSFE